MEKIDVKLSTLNKIDEKFIDSVVKKGKGIIKVTSETYYELYEDEDSRVITLAKEWFDIYAHTSHAYRDGSRIPYENLVKVEIIKRENTKR